MISDLGVGVKGRGTFAIISAMERNDTIAAVATAQGRGGVAIVRVSGPDAFVVAERLTGRRPQPRRVSLESIRVSLGSDRVSLGSDRVNLGSDRVELGSNRVELGSMSLSPTDSKTTLNDFNSTPDDSKSTLRDPNAPLRDSNVTLIDTAVVIAFKSPHSYTGEDVVEFQCHGGAVAPRRVLEACFAAGARLARRGEFTERAFLNGKLTYEQAEGVLDLVNAKTDRAADAALAGLAGARRAEMRAIYEELLALSSAVEHALDVSEEELPDGFTENLLAGVASVDARLECARRRLREGKILREGALVVIAGAPNAGKSSLMNALLGERRAIVSDVPGTTRDSIEEWLDVGGWPVRLVDTAGLRETDDAIEGEGVERARELVARADVVVRLTPAGEPFDSRLSAVDCRGPTVIDVLSKCDLSSDLQPSTFQPSTFNLSSPIPVSSKTGEGLDALRGAIAAELARRADEGRADSAGEGFSGGDAAALARARAALAAPSRDIVLLANALRGAAGALGEATGAEYSADLLDALFSRFCVGK